MILTVQIYTFPTEKPNKKYTFPTNTGIENHTFLKETVFLNKNMDLYTHITPFLLKEIYGKLINIHNMLNPCFFQA